MTEKVIGTAGILYFVFMAFRTTYIMGYTKGYDDHRDGERRRYKIEER